MRLRRFALVVALAAGAVGSAVFAPAAPAAPAPPAVEVLRADFTFVDTSRATPATSVCAAVDSRTLPTIVLYPDPVEGRDRRYPLLVFAHGFLARGSIYQGFFRRIAAAGFVVALPTFPRSSSQPCGALGGDYVNQPGDVSFLITALLEENDDPASPLYRRIREKRIAVGGHSLGAFTSFGFFHSCCLDPRVDAVIPVAGRPVGYPGAGYVWDDGPPLLLIHGDADEVVNVEGSELAYTNAGAPKFFLRILGGSHVPFRLGVTLGGTPPPGEAEIADSMIAFLNRYLAKPRALRNLVDAATEPGITEFEADPR